MNILTGKHILLSLTFIALASLVGCQKKTILFESENIESGTQALLIGLDVLDEETIWASGTNATLLKSTNGGDSWQVFQYTEADTLQFRDVQGLNQKEAIVLSAGEGKASQIFHFHEDNGWKRVYQMQNEKGFLDAIQFWTNGTGLAYGDAIDSSAFILKTTDFGKTWERLPKEKSPIARKGEGGFASSGTNIVSIEGGEAWIGTGAGSSSRIFYTSDYGESWKAYKTPMVKGEAAGITSVRYEAGRLYITGGDLSIEDSYTNNLYYSVDKGKNWNEIPQPITKGAFYGSALASYADQLLYLVTGPQGADVWIEEQYEWMNLSNLNLWTAAFINQNTAILAGRNGEIIKISFY
ncbi:hypothetical protein C9994_02415 [Marivirga lumbricoides]|uniref:Sortilin N-terminal domain-containing protein n=1 Tax=Marivirga lumbricoides TaxID=1046115 RepID=A0A2T4DUS3_9BACT|nr:hypothetical protein C9994_02415 [Marivirga lumbricoides]